jgi:uncharacterized protein YndB with AHSA1/START domain
MEGTKAAGSASAGLEITREFDAPREQVWRAWTEPELLKKWWGPAEFTSPECRMDVRVGGTYHWSMQGPDGNIYWSTGTFRQVDPPERLVLTDNFADVEGNIVPPSYYGLPGEWTEQIVIDVSFDDLGGRTRMTMRQTGIPAGVMSDMTRQGWEGSFDKLAASLK